MIIHMSFSLFIFGETEFGHYVKKFVIINTYVLVLFTMSCRVGLPRPCFEYV